MVHQLENPEKVADDGYIKGPEEETLLPDTKDGLSDLPDDANSDTESSKKISKVLSKDVALQLPSEDTTCGIGFIRGKFLQKLATKNSYAVVYGILGFVFASTYSYMNGIITTLEKRFKIPSTNTGIIMVGSDITTLAAGLLLNYYGGRGHRPRWIGFGTLTVVVYCLMNALCHFIYGPGEDALDLTKEFGGHFNASVTAILIDAENRKSLCQREEVTEDCSTEVGNFAPQVILFCANLIAGIGGSLYYTLGVSYMDDNIPRSKSPLFVSISFFLRMIGPVIGYTLASVCLTIFISPTLTPTITKKDPRWIGAWWMGWLFIAALLAIFGLMLSLFPKTLPKAALRQAVAEENRKAAGKDVKEKKEEIPTSLKDMMITMKRLMKNKALTCNNFASVFFIMGYMPYWIFMPKYIEVIFRQSASFSSFITGVVSLVCAGIGILSSGVYISKAKPSARSLAAWNVFIGLTNALGIFSYTLIGCPINDSQAAMITSGQMETTLCNQNCHCDFVKYSPVCSPDGRTFISPCHAGCSDYSELANGTKVYSNCSCVPQLPSNLSEVDTQDLLKDPDNAWVLTEGICPVDCSNKLIIFMAVFSIVKLAACVDDADKTIGMAIGVVLMSIFAFVPSPILFGHIIDTTCLVWGKTCSGSGNCWLYDADKLRHRFNLTASVFICIGCMFDIALWYFVKGLKIFEEEEDMEFNVPPHRTKTERR
ncbi:hypothetical protein J6590_011460 [Homalodisca vitripennis]|nr:hypothetical protein J6590_011460 [Homalodisca vitripennis]